MKRGSGGRGLFGVVALSTCAGLCACVPHTRPEDAAVVMPKPAGPDLAGNLPARSDYPSIGGDILAGYTPAELAAARAAATRLPAKPRNPPPAGN